MCQNIWPINEATSRSPENWPGWPDKKKFAFVLTHDVEGSEGLAKCRQLMQCEMRLGFRSSFNFVPEGGATVPVELRAELRQNGFEVGVHDLNHDGKLYRNRKEFAEKAVRINQYLKDWGAVGFRSGFMFRNLEWFHDIKAMYDASTFDTDPFEPQSDGAETIFPFWVTGINAPGYVELPYTLPQDSTLFLLLQETTPDIWLKKLDWVASHGGMALLNVHPDYIRFNGEAISTRTYPAAFYEKLLNHVREKYGETYWQPLPMKLAAFAAQVRPLRHPRPKRVCMVTHSYYLSDTRVIQYAEALAKRGDHVDVLALQPANDAPGQTKIRDVNLVRLQPRLDRKEQSRMSYLFPLVRFLFASARWIAREHARKPYDLLHIHNVPDFMVFAAAYPRWTGARVILDIHDIVPELYASKFGKSEKGLLISLLKWMERLSARMADHVIIANHLWLEKYEHRTGAVGKCSVFINNVDAGIFQPSRRTRNDGKLVILFPGGLQWHQGLDIAIGAFHKIRGELPHAEFHIYGEGDMKSNLVSQAQELGLNGSVRFFNRLPVHEIARVMAEADLGVVPKRADSFGNEAYSTKIMQFMSLRVPVVVSNTKIDRYYFDDSVVRFFESGNSGDLAVAMLELLRDEALRHNMVARAAEYAARNSWNQRKGDYLKLVDDLCGKHEKLD